MMHLPDGQLKGVVHFKWLVAVQGFGETFEKGIHPKTSFSPEKKTIARLIG